MDERMRDNHVRFYKPELDDLWFKRRLLSDPETMRYNQAWGGVIPFPRDQWEAWLERWVRCEDGKRFYRYITIDRSRMFVGEAAYHYDEASGAWLADVIILGRERGKGYGRAGLRLLCEAAQRNGIAVLKDKIAADNPAVQLFLEEGFEVEARTEQSILVAKTLR